MQVPVPEGYSNRYEKIRSSKLRSFSPSHTQPHSTSPHINTQQHRNQGQYESQQPGNQIHSDSESRLGKVVSDLTDRVDGIEIKIVNITNIIKLFQSYTQTRDIQYEKEKETQEFYRKHGASNLHYIENLDVQTKINEMESLIQRTKVQMTAMEGLRVNIERQTSKKFFTSPDHTEALTQNLNSPSPNQFQFTNPESNHEVMEEIEDLIDRVEENLRQELNKKIQICLNFYKNAVQSLKQNFEGKEKIARNSSPSSPTNVNTVMLEEQIHNMTLTLNKVESDCLRSNMLTEHKINQIVAYVQTMKGLGVPETIQLSRRSRSTNRRGKYEQDENIHKSPNSSVSRKEKSKSERDKSKREADNECTKKSPVHSTTRLEDQKKQKEMELKEALKRKRENQQKLKMKR